MYKLVSKLFILPTFFIASQLNAADCKEEIMLCAHSHGSNSDVEKIIFDHLDCVREHDCVCDAYKDQVRIFLQEMKNGGRYGQKYVLAGKLFCHINAADCEFKNYYWLCKLKESNYAQFQKYKTFEIITVDTQLTQDHVKKFEQLKFADFDDAMKRLSTTNFVLTYKEQPLGFKEGMLQMVYVR